MRDIVPLRFTSFNLGVLELQPTIVPCTKRTVLCKPLDSFPEA
jgi:hypothetical protein